MGRGVAVWMGGAILMLGVGGAWARAAHDLNDDELRAEMVRNRALRAYVERNGMPDVAEAHFLADTPPWDDHEVTIYYLDGRKELGFARAYILGRPDVQIERYRRPISEDRMAALQRRARARDRQAAQDPAGDPGTTAPAASAQASGATQASTGGHAIDPPPSNLGPDERAELAARRAEEAAGRIEMAAASAEQAAEHTEAVVSRMATAPAARRGRRK